MQELNYTSDIFDDESLFQYIVEGNKYYNNKIRQKLKYKGKRIDFGKHTVDICDKKIFSQFIHISAFSDDNNFSTVPRPCLNEEYSKLCNNCIDRMFLRQCNGKKRAWCIYRISLIPLLRQIMKNIEAGTNDYIEIGEREEFCKEKCKRETVIHIRHNDGNIYYYIKLKKVDDNFRGDYYSFVCGYPVFYDSKKIELDRLFEKK